MYFTPYTPSAGDERFDNAELGIIVTPRSYRPARYDLATPGCVWIADNDCFNRGAEFDLDAYLEWLAGIPEAARRQAIFATAPDVVGDWIATLERSLPVLDPIRDAGFPAALVLQDGATRDTVPWDAIDAVFVGGSTEWKLGARAADICRYAEGLGLWTHMGRVNSIKRMVRAAEMGCWSADGTMLCFGPRAHLPRLDRMIDTAYATFGDVLVEPGWNRYAPGSTSAIARAA